MAWLPVEQYIKTIANSTSYGCLYFTDESGRPFQLRATYATEHWQWPGGNLDPGETPLQCALRECREEIGFVPEDREFPLLGVQFLLPRAEWPCPHIGFIFDGGLLTRRQLDSVVLSEEHSEWAVRTVEEWRQLMAPGNFARMGEIHRAQLSGRVAYFEV
jgi:8-oxo-dGTP diphosphatase